MKNELAGRVRRVAVTDPIAAARRHDYADAFEVRLPGPDPFPPEAWVRAGLGATPGFVNRIVALLGFRDPPAPAADRLSVFRIVESGPEMVHLEASVPLLRVVMVGRNVGPGRRRLTTLLRYERPVLARLVMTVIGVGHRWAVPRVITGEVSTG